MLTQDDDQLTPMSPERSQSAIDDDHHRRAHANSGEHVSRSTHDSSDSFSDGPNLSDVHYDAMDTCDYHDQAARSTQEGYEKGTPVGYCLVT